MSRKKANSRRARISVSRSSRDTASPLQRILNRERGRVVEDKGVARYEYPANDPVAEQRQAALFSFFKGRYQRIPVIDTMRDREQLTEQEHRALAYYRDQAALSERSPTKSCLDNSQGGSGDIPIGAAITSAILTTARIERDMGQLWPIARAIAVDDKSLTQWCIDKHGGRERYDGKGKFVAIVPVREKVVMGTALMELRMAAHRIVL